MNHQGLLPKKAFYSRLNDEHISDKDYLHYIRVCTDFNVHYFRKYVDLYLKCDVLQTMDRLVNFQEKIFDKFGLDITKYCTLPSLAEDCLKKETACDLELLTDLDMYQQFEKGIRGGISTVVTRHFKANNYMMGNEYDPSKPDVWITAFDYNSLYPSVMRNCYPTGNFSLMTKKELEKWYQYDCHLVVDLHMPYELRNEFDELPLAPEHRDKKLLCTFHDKKKYPIFSFALKEYLKYGMKLVDVHCGIKFSACDWMKTYIENNNENHKSAKNKFEKNLWKKVGNSGFGKFIENVRNRSNIELATDKQQLKRLVRKPTLVEPKRLDENNVLFRLLKKQVTLNKPIYIGAAILDYAKCVFYNRWFNYLKKKFTNIEFLFGDTDSYYVGIVGCYDIYEAFKDHDEIDTRDVKCLPLKNASKLGKLNFEYGDKTIVETVALSPKAYALRFADDSVKKSAKGVKKSSIKHQISFDDYLNCVKFGKDKLVDVCKIQSRDITLFSKKSSKRALNWKDTKRKILEDGIHTKAW